MPEYRAPVVVNLIVIELMDSVIERDVNFMLLFYNEQTALGLLTEFTAKEQDDGDARENWSDGNEMTMSKSSVKVVTAEKVKE